MVGKRTVDVDQIKSSRVMTDPTNKTQARTDLETVGTVEHGFVGYLSALLQLWLMLKHCFST